MESAEFPAGHPSDRDDSRCCPSGCRLVATALAVRRSPLHFLLTCRNRPVLLLDRLYPVALSLMLNPTTAVALPPEDAWAINAAFRGNDCGDADDVLLRQPGRNLYRWRSLPDLVVDHGLLDGTHEGITPALAGQLRSCVELDPTSFDHLEAVVLHHQLQGTPATEVWAAAVGQHPACVRLIEEVVREEAPRRRVDFDHMVNSVWLILAPRFTREGFSFDPARGKLLNWLAAVVRRACGEVEKYDWRAAKKEKATGTEPEILMNHVDPATTKERQRTFLEYAYLRHAINDLDDDCRLVCVLTNEGHSLDEIGTITGHNKSWAQRQLEKARALLRERWRDVEDKPGA